jgi:hypothetical protein
VQKVVEAEHSTHGDSHRLHSFATLVKPEGQAVTHDPLKKRPLAHEHTPLTGLVPLGQLLRQSPLDNENPLTHEKHCIKSAVQLAHG